MLGQVADDFIGGDVADRHGDGQIFAAIGLAAHRAAAALRLMAEVHQVFRFRRRGCTRCRRAPPSPPSAAERNELLATEATAVAVAGEHFDFCFVYQFHCFDARDAAAGRHLEACRPGATRPSRSCFNSKARRSALCSTPMPGHGCRRCLDQASAETMLTVRRFLAPLDRELHLAIHEGEQGVVTAQANARTRVELGAALTHDDVAGFDGLAAEDLDAQVLRVGVATVARGAYALLCAMTASPDA